MTVNKIQEGEALRLVLAGRLDSATAPQFQGYVDGLAGVKDLVIDINDLEYISSAGLRLMLKAQKMMQSQGSMKLVGANAVIMEVLDMTGFTDILTVEAK